METSLQSQLKSWRQHLHQHPETGFEEVATADYVANILQTLGLEVHRGIGGTGLVANLTVGSEKASSDCVPIWTRSISSKTRLTVLTRRVRTARCTRVVTMATCP